MLNNAQYVAQMLEVNSDDRICIPLPLYHCMGMVMGTLVCMSKGATMVSPSSSFDAASALDAIEKYGCTGLYGVPTMFTAILTENEKNPRNVSTLKKGIISGSACPAPLINKIYSDLNMTGLC